MAVSGEKISQNSIKYRRISKIWVNRESKSTSFWWTDRPLFLTTFAKYHTQDASGGALSLAREKKTIMNFRICNISENACDNSLFQTSGGASSRSQKVVTCSSRCEVFSTSLFEEENIGKVRVCNLPKCQMCTQNYAFQVQIRISCVRTPKTCSLP